MAQHGTLGPVTLGFYGQDNWPPKVTEALTGPNEFTDVATSQ